jgi:hypothetical protein
MFDLPLRAPFVAAIFLELVIRKLWRENNSERAG